MANSAYAFSEDDIYRSNTIGTFVYLSNLGTHNTNSTRIHESELTIFELLL